MNLAGTQRLARRLHRGEIDETGHAYVGHLARVAALVAAYGGDEAQQMAAWVHGVGRTGCSRGTWPRSACPAGWSRSSSR